MLQKVTLGTAIAFSHCRTVASRDVTNSNMKGEREMSNQVYGYITDRIMEELERGCVPWNKPWKSPGCVRMPTNYASKKPYRGVNTFLLAV